MGKADLIKTVRSLDQNGPGEDGENLRHLWKSLSVTVDGQFHAAEESTLRWLLKSMNGPSPAAETLRRYPLTWQILESVFRRIPLFSLAKSLADRRFMVILQQVLKEISTPPTETDSQTSAKRKRSSPDHFTLAGVQSTDGCLKAGKAIFGALSSLLDRLESTAMLSSHDKIGAEHIKSLFNAPAEEAAVVTASALLVCDSLVRCEWTEDSEECEPWIRTIGAIWNLHLQSNDDVVQVVTHIFNPAATLLNNLDQMSFAIDEGLRRSWTANLRSFMSRILIQPARATYIARQDLGPITSALEVSKLSLNVSAPVLYALAASEESKAQQGLRKGKEEWAKQLFKAVGLAIKGRSDVTAILRRILETAESTSMPIDISDLRSVCREYALTEDDTDWILVARVAKCDPDVFQKADDGRDLLREICQRMPRHRSQSSEHYDLPVSRVVASILQGFRTARDLSGFLRLWYEQLCEAGEDSPWFIVGRQLDGELSVDQHIEKELSPQQLLDVLGWLEKQDAQDEALCLWLSVVAQGITREEFKDTTYQTLFKLVSQVKGKPSTTTALKWRVISRAISWSAPEQRTLYWEEMKPRLSKILKKGEVLSAETFEAFKCCCSAWQAMSPDDDKVEEPAKLAETFTKDRLATIKTKPDDARDDSKALATDVDTYDPLLGIQQYLRWFLRGSPRLQRLYYERENAHLSLLEPLLSGSGTSPRTLLSNWRTLLSNEHIVNETKYAGVVVDRAADALQKTKAAKSWPGETGRLWLQVICSIPIDTITRPQRERIMAIIIDDGEGKQSEKLTLEDWRLVLTLATKLMARPTFYEGMQFSHLIHVADNLSKAAIEESASEEELLELIDRFAATASVTIGQMAERIEDRSLSYLKESHKLISSCKDGLTTGLGALRLILLKTLVGKMSDSPACRHHDQLSLLLQEARDVSSHLLAATASSWVSEATLIEKSDTTSTNLLLLAVVDAASVAGDLSGLAKLKSSSVKKFEAKAQQALEKGTIRDWKLQILLRRCFMSALDHPYPRQYQSLRRLPARLRTSLLRELVGSVVAKMDSDQTMQYLGILIAEYTKGHETDGQLIAVQCVLDRIIETPDSQSKAQGYDLMTAHSELTQALMTVSTLTNFVYICRTLTTVLERKPQAVGQWNVELTLSTAAALSSSPDATVSFAWLCKLVEVIIKKHRLRLEGHYHILLAAIQPLVRSIALVRDDDQSGSQQEAKAHAVSRLITLVCEPTAGAVSRTQFSSALDSATDVAKRTAGRHMYLVLMQYVKLQLETDVPRSVRVALEPAMNSIWDVTPPETRKILNDAMDASGRAILREMFKRYTKFGKWSGV